MDRLVAEKWVTALRSGEYNQTRSYLQDEDGFCCLGVLCDLHRKESGTELNWIKPEDRACYLYDKYDATLPESVKAWAGMDSHGGDRGFNSSLWELNDCEGYSFDRIANVIEKEWKEL